MTHSARFWVLDTMTARFDLLKQPCSGKSANSIIGARQLSIPLSKHVRVYWAKKSQRGKRAAGKSGDAPKPTYLNLAANQTLQAGEAVLYKGGRLSRLNRALKKEQDDGGLRTCFPCRPLTFRSLAMPSTLPSSGNLRKNSQIMCPTKVSG